MPFIIFDLVHCFMLCSLQEFGIDEPQEIFTKFDRVFERLTGPLVRAVDTFAGILNRDGGFNGQVNQLIKEIEEAPTALDPMITTVDGVYNNISSYSGLPWIEGTRNHVGRLKYFLQDVRADVVEFVNVSLIHIFHMQLDYC